MRTRPPMSRRPPRSSGSGWRRRFVLAGIASIAIGSAGCRPGIVIPGLGIDGLLVADGGSLQVTDATGSLVPFDGPSDPVVQVAASDGVVVAVDAGGRAVTSNGSVSPRAWRPLELSGVAGAGVRLVALSPLGRELAIVAGEPQGSAFDLVIVDVGLGTSRTIPIPRGLNGPPSWLGPGTVAVNVIGRDGTSAIATIEVGTGALADRAGAGTVVVSSIDRAHLAADDPATGDVLVGSVADWRGGAAALARLAGPTGTGVERLAMSASGDRLAVVRRSDAGLTIEILRRADDGTWATVRTLRRTGDDPVSIAWLN